MDTPTEFDKRVAAAVAGAIEDSGVKTVWLCDRTGIPRTTLSRRLSGHTSFTVAELGAIAHTLRVPVETLSAPPPLDAEAVPA